MAAQAGEFLPRPGTIGGPEQRRILDPRIHCIRIGQRRFEVPDPLELPRVRCAVVPLVRPGCAVVDERIPGSFPRLTAVVRALDDLSEPAARLGGIDSIRVGGGSLEMINLPATKVGAADVPAFTLPVRRQDEGALSRANQ